MITLSSLNYPPSTLLPYPPYLSLVLHTPHEYSRYCSHPKCDATAFFVPAEPISVALVTPERSAITSVLVQQVSQTLPVPPLDS